MATPATPTSGHAPSSSVGNAYGNAGPINTAGNPNAMASSSTAPPSSSATFAVGEKVLCYHGPIIYEAKVLQAVDYASDPAPLTGQFGMHYYVHYKGWKRTWDEWVHSSRLLKTNEENFAKQKATQASLQPTSGANASGASNHKPGGGTTSSKAGGAGISARAAAASRKDAKSLKRMRDEGERAEDMRLVVPASLKKILVDDWERVKKGGQLVEIPASPTAVEILDDFTKYILDMDPKPEHLREPEQLLDTITSGLKTYFDKSLGTNLLYLFERNQHSKMREEYWTGQHVVPGAGHEKEMSEIYGAEHLLRMLVSLPTMLAQSTLDKASLDIIRDYTNELIQYMAQEKDRLFQKKYFDPTVQDHAKS